MSRKPIREFSGALDNFLDTDVLRLSQNLRHENKAFEMIALRVSYKMYYVN